MLLQQHSSRALFYREIFLIRVTLLACILGTAPLAAQTGLPGSPITNAGVLRADSVVQAVFLERTVAVDTADIGDFTAYLLARLGVPPFPDGMGFRVTADSARARISGTLGDFPPETVQELGAIFFFLDSSSTFVAEISLPQRTGGVMRFRLERVLVKGFTIPEILLIPALREYDRRYPVLASGGREFVVAMPPEASVRFVADGIEMRMPPSSRPE